MPAAAFAKRAMTNSALLTRLTYWSTVGRTGVTRPKAISSLGRGGTRPRDVESRSARRTARQNEHA